MNATDVQKILHMQSVEKSWGEVHPYCWDCGVAPTSIEVAYYKKSSRFIHYHWMCLECAARSPQITLLMLSKS